MATQLIESGAVTRRYLGIPIQPLTPELAESFDPKSREGILVAKVCDDSPAPKTGLRQGDVIVACHGDPLKDVGSFPNEVALTPPGKREQLAIVRDGQQAPRLRRFSRPIRSTMPSAPADACVTTAGRTGLPVRGN